MILTFKEFLKKGLIHVFWELLPCNENFSGNFFSHEIIVQSPEFRASCDGATERVGQGCQTTQASLIALRLPLPKIRLGVDLGVESELESFHQLGLLVRVSKSWNLFFSCPAVHKQSSVNAIRRVDVGSPRKTFNLEKIYVKLQEECLLTTNVLHP